jgi:hypothetical protein
MSDVDDNQGLRMQKMMSKIKTTIRAKLKILNLAS